MKTQTIRIILLVSVISGLVSLKARTQFYSWSTPAAISDSIADNRNPLIIELPIEEYLDYFFFWERSVDSTATAIYYRNFYDQGEPVALLDEPMVHFRNPRFILTYDTNPDTLFYLFYESDQSGTFDLYYKVYTTLGFGDPVMLDGSTENVSHFRCNKSKILTWQLGDKIKTARLADENSMLSITDIVTLDSTDCSSPELPPGNDFDYYNYIAWIKGDTINNTIYYSEHSTSWSTPVPLYDTGYNTSLRFAGSTCSDEYSFDYVLSWDNLFEGEHTIKAMDLYDGDFTSSFTQETPFFPAVSIYLMPIDELYQQGFMSFVYDNEQNGDIYVNEEGWGILPDLENYVNLSNSPYEEANPAFFNGRWNLDDRDQILTWASERNGHWQLFYSTNSILCTGGTTENANLAGPSMKVSPNPVCDRCVINYSMPENDVASIKFYTMDGKEIVIMDKIYLQKGDHELDLNLNRYGSAIPKSGLMLIKLETSKSSASYKILRIP